MERKESKEKIQGLSNQSLFEYVICRGKWHDVSGNMETRAFSLYNVHCEWCISRTPSPFPSSYSHLFLPAFPIHPEQEVKKFGLSLGLNFYEVEEGRILGGERGRVTGKDGRR